MSEQQSFTPALDEIQGATEGDVVSPEVYFKAALECIDMLGQSLSEVGSIYMLLRAMVGAIEPKESDG